MFAAVLFIIGMYTAVGFNIFTKPVSKFTNDDQSNIQSKDRVFVPSPTSGDVFRCAEKNCSRINVAGVTKGLRPAVSVTSSWREDKEQLHVCNQVRTINSSTENFNGNCTHISDHQEKSKIYPNKLVLQLLEQKAMDSNNNNNNKNQGSQTSLYRDHWRKRRALQNDPSTDTDEEDEDAGTEITFVLDGSGSIEQEDFERAKDFIYNVMKNVWTTCFSCKFAVVQYGRDIRTELSLNENNERLRALDKVKNIKQIHAITKTASALYHVLTDVFVPQSGSKENAKKKIILLSDGEMAGDERNLTEVLNMPQMEGIVRYAIGVGPEVLNKTQAIKEMTEIAGSEDRFFSVCNYAALENILSSLEKSIIRIEDAGTEITFVLDGSSSIDPQDIESAKDFISNVMKNVWTTCFSCKFAVVQYGRDIRTELSLQENNDHLRALDKVKSIKQIYGITKTASALYHVLTDIFVPQNGSKENAKKMIILLSDGEMAGDERNLTEVLNMRQMEGIVRYAIGLGPEVLNKPQAIKEMMEIASSEDRFFKVSNYAELKNILSSLEKNIIRIEDAGTEIAFVLDGSGSIEPPDFERAKDFISNVMNNVWTTCFSCKFAVVQYGRDIRTELSLKENNEHLRALDKVKNIKQIHAITKTASALYHVLTDVFVPQSGSKENAKKKIILLSDGEMAGDERNLTEVLNMPQMEGIVRYAIGLGPEVLLKRNAIQEMIEIAGGEERFFRVSSYAALEDILSTLEKSILRSAGRGIQLFCHS
ncbi:hypothetical protein PHYPO_G00051160 [Pangasianodon hypophthalmus]|uniref:VWFA domain-containing protein n=1 Tax=Pangasianodon hypophthalmus TaxID=310915 RepID=A0A5N5M7M0_PANHP|nr:hypothetical protein PHYPO_G00051160 [Pangasianodon hypophthalmus]